MFVSPGESSVEPDAVTAPAASGRTGADGRQSMPRANLGSLGAVQREIMRCAEARAGEGAVFC